MTLQTPSTHPPDTLLPTPPRYRSLLGREAPADPILGPGEDVDAEGPGRLDAGPRAGAPPGEEGQRRRLQRHRGEGAHGHAERTVAVVGGDDGDARGEVAEDLAELGRVERGGCGHEGRG